MERKESRPEAVLRSLSGLQAGDDVRDNSPGPEMIINREQERLYERKGAVLSLSVKFVTSSHLIAALKPVKNKRKKSFPWPIERDSSQHLLLSPSCRRNEEQSYGQMLLPQPLHLHGNNDKWGRCYIIVMILDLFSFPPSHINNSSNEVNMPHSSLVKELGSLILKFTLLTKLLPRWLVPRFLFCTEHNPTFTMEVD